MEACSIMDSAAAGAIKGAATPQIAPDLSDREHMAVIVTDALGLFPFRR